MQIIDIINGALIKIGANPILSLTADTKEARLASTRLTPVVDIVLRLHPWSCVKKQAVLQATTTPPLVDYVYSLPLPSDFLRLVKIDQSDYMKMANAICCDSARAEITYIARPESLIFLDSLCAETVSCYLAWDICYPITQSNDLVQLCWKAYLHSLKQARFVNAIENPAGVYDCDVITQEHN